MNGPCFKQTVTATVIAPDGRRFVGTNDCKKPQTYCPRVNIGAGFAERYDLCHDVCQQTGHAEFNALIAAGSNCGDAVMYIEGHTKMCPGCEYAAECEGIKEIKFEAPPKEQA